MRFKGREIFLCLFCIFEGIHISGSVAEPFRKLNLMFLKRSSNFPYSSDATYMAKLSVYKMFLIGGGARR